MPPFLNSFIHSFIHSFLQVVVACTDMIPLTSLNVEDVGYLLDSLELGEYRESFAAGNITGKHLNVVDTNAKLAEKRVRMPDLDFDVLVHSIQQVCQAFKKLHFYSLIFLFFNPCFHRVFSVIPFIVPLFLNHAFVLAFLPVAIVLS
jgi:hypothetical protein